MTPTDEDFLQDSAEGWRPKDGDTIIGTITDLSRGWSDYKGEFYPIITIQPEDGSDSRAVHGFHFTLEDKILELRPQVGETIGIKFNGKVKSKDGKRTIAVYTVRVKGRSADIYADMKSSRKAKAQQQRVQEQDQQVIDESTDDIPF